VRCLWTTSPESYRPETLPEWAFKSKTAALQRKRPAGYEGHELSLQKHLKRTSNLSMMANPLPVNTNPTDDLKDDLQDAMQKPDKEEYIPHDVLERLTSNEIFERVVKDIISKCSALREKREYFASTLRKDCRILVAIFVYDNLSNSLLETLVQNGITDKSLALPSKCPFSLSVRHDRSQYDRLYNTQWRFTAAVFHKVGQCQQFDKIKIVPYLEKIEIGHGGFSTVHEVRIEPSHQKLCSLPTVRILFLVFKIIYRETRNNGEIGG
jgi:hypothetical protein